MKYLTSGFFQIPRNLALELCANKLPKHGYEKASEYLHTPIWVTRSIVHGKEVWTMRTIKNDFATAEIWRAWVRALECKPVLG